MTLRLIIAAVLVIAGVVLIAVNARKLVSDWPRPKPRHNVDVAWLQVYLGLAAVAIGCVIIRNPARALFEPTPHIVRSDAGGVGPN